MLWSDADMLLLVHVNDSGAVEGSSQRLHVPFLQNATKDTIMQHTSLHSFGLVVQRLKRMPNSDQCF